MSGCFRSQTLVIYLPTPTYSYQPHLPSQNIIDIRACL